jgi:hypothetical protein
MKLLISIIAMLILLPGCTLLGVRSGNVQEDNRAPDVVESTDEHLGDPTFRRETVDTEVAGYQREVPKDAVVGRDNTPPPSYDSDLVAGLALYEEGKLRDARKRLSSALDNHISIENEAKALAALRAINEKIFLSTGPEGDLRLYKVASGDYPAKIANKVGSTWEMIVRLNGLTDRDIRTLQIGRQLKVPNGTFELHVRRSKHAMDLVLDGQFIQRYEVGLGVGGSTPLGDFWVKNRIPQPADGAYAYGHAKHRLGSRWLGLENLGGYEGYGIHGCRAEEERLIPGDCSEGCVRMRNAEVEEIFDIVPVKTKVVITER